VLNGNVKNLSREREEHMKSYTQPTQEERYHISVLCKERFPKAEKAHRLNRHRSTITRELRRNTGMRGYRAKQAQHNASHRQRTAKKAIKLTRKTIRLIIEKINEKWNPEQISGWLRQIQSKVRNSVCILCILKVVKSLTVAESQTSIAEQVGVNQSTISRFANKDEAQVLIEKEQLKLVEVLPDTVQNVKDLVEEMKDIPKGDIKRRELYQSRKIIRNSRDK
jgi:IS30 family transposase